RDARRLRGAANPPPRAPGGQRTRGGSRPRAGAPALPRRAARHRRPTRRRHRARDEQPSRGDVELAEPGPQRGAKGQDSRGGRTPRPGPRGPRSGGRHRASSPGPVGPREGALGHRGPEPGPARERGVPGVAAGIRGGELRARAPPHAPARAGKPGHARPGGGEPDPQRLRSAAARGRGAHPLGARRRARGGRDRRPRAGCEGVGPGAHLRAVLLHQGLDRPRALDLPLHREAARGGADRRRARGRGGAVPDDPARAGGSVSALERTGSRGRLLVVEDEAYVRDSLVAVLRAKGFDAEPAVSAAQALAHVARAPVDVVLSDLRMPGADGLELLRRLQASAPEVPVVILTGHGNVASAVECLKAGASDYVLKPADPEALEVTLQRVLDARALRREVRYLRSAVAPAAEPVGDSASWRKVLAMVEAAAPTD